MAELLAGSVAVVTGAGGGIGSAIAERLARSGADIVLVDRDFAFTKEWGGSASAAPLIATLEGMGRRVLVAEGDASDRAVVEKVVGDALGALGKIDVLVNCAGGAFTPPERSFASVAIDEDYDVLFQANYRTTVAFSQGVVPSMMERRRGSIVNISSGFGPMVSRNGSLAHYFASKAAVTSYTSTLAQEVGKHGIRVNAVSPGYVPTARAGSQGSARGQGRVDQVERIPLRRFGEPDDIAKGVEFFASDMASYVTGQTLVVAGG